MARVEEVVGALLLLGIAGETAQLPERIELIVDKDTYKNSISVATPNTPYYGIVEPACIAVMFGVSAYGLEVLKDVIFEGMPEEYYPRTLEDRDIDWYCGCNKERMGKALMTIGTDELTTILKEDGQAELSCQFCRSSYTFTGKELREMIYAIAGAKE